VRLLPALRAIGCRMIALTASKDSTIGRGADIVLEIGRLEEPCPLRMAPSASTTALLAMGDALALCVQKARGFGETDFARYHPGGSLGRLLSPVESLMRTGDRMASASPETLVIDALKLMAKTRNGAAVATDSEGRLQGVFTHGDFSRVAMQDTTALLHPIGRHMTRPGKNIRSGALVQEALDMMHGRINALPVVDADMRVLGILDIQDLV